MSSDRKESYQNTGKNHITDVYNKLTHFEEESRMIST